MVTPNEGHFLTGAGDRAPLGALYVATAAKEAGHRVRFYDLNHSSLNTLMRRYTRETTRCNCL